MKIVIIDDNDMSQQLLKSILTRRGDTVVGQANTISAARELIKSSQPDLVMLDILMPDGNGMDLLA